MPSVIILDDLAQEGLDLLAKAPGITYEVRTKLKGAELKQALTEFDAAICRSGVKLTPDILEGNTRLKAVARAGVGVDNIDCPAATKQGIVVMNTPAGNTISTAEHTLAMMMALSRNIAPAYQAVLEGKWKERGKYMGKQLAGKTLGIVGLGRIGQTVASRARAMEMRLVGYEPVMSPERGQELGIELYSSVREMLPHVDYLTVHTPLTPETKGLICEETLPLLKPGVRLINCARGGIYDEAALLKGLESGKIAGIALDVMTEEPCAASPLFGKPGVLVTPHLGASTEEAQTNVAIEAAELIIDFLSTGAIRHSVNMAPIDRKDLDTLRHYLDVAYRLGLLSAQMVRGAPKACTLQFKGEVADKNTRLLKGSFAVGLLEHAMPGHVNIVNAEVLLRERGIDLTEQKSRDRGDFTSLITVDLATDQKTYTVAGTVFGKQLERLVRLGEFRLDAYLDGILFVFTHQDVPGIVGTVGTILGKHKVNIGQMSVGRANKGGDAIGVLNLDNEPPQAAIDELLKTPGISSGKVIKLPAAGALPGWLS